MHEENSGTVLVRVDGFAGDDIENVSFFEIDAAVEREIRRFIQTGECEPKLSEQFMALAPETIPAYPSLPPTDIQRSGREYLCAAYVCKFGQAVQEDLRLIQQYK